MSDKLPSIDDFTEEPSDLPSVEDLITEEKELPSIDEFVEKEEEIVEEEINEEVEEEEVAGQLVDLTEVIRLVNDVRKDIPEIPEIKSYDEELKQLVESLEEIKGSIPEIPEIKYYDAEVSAICEQIDLVREEISGLPEVKYYDEQVDVLEEKVTLIKQELRDLPEIKNYDVDLQSIREEIQEVRKSIVPDFGWIGNTFNVIDANVNTLNDGLAQLKTKFDSDIQSLSEELDVKDFDKKVEIKDVNERLYEVKDKIWQQFKETSLTIWDHHKAFKDDDRKLKKQILGQYNIFKENIESQIEEYSNSQNIVTDSLREYFETLKEDISNLPTPKYYDNSIKDLEVDVSLLKEKREEQGVNIAQLYKIVNELRGNLEEGLLNISPTEKTSDPLTPTNQEFKTLAEFQRNYRLFVNRVQEQLATFGGGGSVELQYLTDISCIATNLSAYDGMYLTVDTSQEAGKNFKFASVSGGGSGLWIDDGVGVSTTANIGIGTTAAKANYALFVQGEIQSTGNLTVAGIVTYKHVEDIYSVGIITGMSDLDIRGNAHIVGVLTAGSASITIDGDNDIISIGNTVTLTDSYVNIGAGVSISAFSSGINSAPNVLYVAKDGNDDNNGTSIDNAFLTIGGAVGAATSGYTVKVLSGNYQETNPIEVPAFVAIVGDDQRSVKVSGSVTHKDIFSVRKGVKLANMTFQNHVAPAAAVGFPTGEIAENVGGGRWKGPYIQNCTSSTTTGTGIRIDGNQARLLKAMNVDAFTQYNEGGVGVAVTNGGFAQLVSLFTICCNEAVTCDKGAQADIANSNCSFGTYGLVARGVNDLQYSGIVTSSAAASQDNVVLNITNTNPSYNISDVDYTHQTGVATVTTSAAHNFQVGMGVTLADIVFSCTYGSKTYPYRRPYVFEVDSLPSTTKFVTNLGISTVAHTYSSGGTARIETDRPYDGQVVYFGTLYNSVETITVGSGGTGYTSTPTITIDAPAGPNGETATAFATVENESITSISIISNGSQYSSTPTITIGSPDVGINTATATAGMAPIYYTINSSTPVTAGITTLTLDENLINTVGVGTTAYFFEVSKIIASSHTFEYVGAGNEIANATPKRGGVTVQANEVITEDGGKVLYTSTDQSGNFRIGDDLQINQNTGTISGRSFSKSLFSEMTPFILALS